MPQFARGRPSYLNTNEENDSFFDYITSMFGGPTRSDMSSAEIDAAMAPSIYANEQASNFIHGPEGTVAASNVTQPIATRGWTEAQILENINNEIDLSNAINLSASPEDIAAQNRQVYEDHVPEFAKPVGYYDDYSQSYVQPFRHPNDATTWATPGLEPSLEQEGGFGWDFETQSQEGGLGWGTPGGMSQPAGAGRDTRRTVSDPVAGRNLRHGPLDTSKGSFPRAYEAEQTPMSRVMTVLGEIFPGGAPAQLANITRKGVNMYQDKPLDFDPRNIGLLDQGDRYANLVAAQHFADQGPEGWVQSSSVGNYNPLSGPTPPEKGRDIAEIIGSFLRSSEEEATAQTNAASVAHDAAYRAAAGVENAGGIEQGGGGQGDVSFGDYLGGLLGSNPGGGWDPSGSGWH